MNFGGRVFLVMLNFELLEGSCISIVSGFSGVSVVLKSRYFTVLLFQFYSLDYEFHFKFSLT